MSHQYKLEGHTPVPVDDTIEWARWFETANRIVAQDRVGERVLVSTVFLGIDHNFFGTGRPRLFETMVFRDGHGDDCERCATWDEAVAQHAEVLARELASPPITEGPPR